VVPLTPPIFYPQGNDPLAGSGDEFDLPKPKLGAALQGATSATYPFLRGVKDTIDAFDPRKLPPGPQLFANAWPLLAMWPILFVVTEIEHSLGINL
jgi:hypothetical protein